jgi:hypothetical protein
MRLISLGLPVLRRASSVAAKNYSSLLCRAKSTPNGLARFVDRGRVISGVLPRYTLFPTSVLPGAQARSPCPTQERPTWCLVRWTIWPKLSLSSMLQIDPARSQLAQCKTARLPKAPHIARSINGFVRQSLFANRILKASQCLYQAHPASASTSWTTDV